MISLLLVVYWSWLSFFLYLIALDAALKPWRSIGSSILAADGFR